MSLKTHRVLLSDNEPTFRWRDFLRAYWFLLGKYRMRWVLYTSFLFILNFYYIIPPILLGKSVDFFTRYHSGDSLVPFYWYAGILSASFVTVSFLRLATKNLFGDLQSEVMYHTKVLGFEKLMDFSLAWHLEESAGAKVQRIKSGVDSFRQLNQRLTNDVMRGVGLLLGTFIVFLVLRPLYCLFFILYIVGFWTILLSYAQRIRKENDQHYLALEQAGGSFAEGLHNILTIKTLGAGNDFKKHIAGKEEISKKHEYTIRHLYNSLWKTFQAFNGITYGLFLFFVGRDVFSGIISAGSLVIFYGYLQNLIGNAHDMMDSYEIILDSKAGLGRMMGILWKKNTSKEGSKLFPQTWDAIRLHQAQFSYKRSGTTKEKQTKREALRHVTLTIPRNAKIGVVGKTGSGKSTLAKILAGLYPLHAGTYTIGDTSFYDLLHLEQTKHLTLVLQETEIFYMNLRDNITLLQPLDEARLQKALRIAELIDVVEKLPQGLDTLVGEKGYHLSGGERQRVGIARAIYRNAPILVFDEATSSLDSRTESRIQHALDTELTDSTLISIAHRVSTLQNTDRIYVFENGDIVEEGTFQELSANPNSKFYALSHAQRTMKQK